jgi:N-succinyl-L-ornithine transcarbamylase
MKKFTSVNDILSVKDLVSKAIEIKKNPFEHDQIGKNKVLGLVFFNASLRTRLSTQKAAMNLGLNCMVMNIDKEAWAIETMEGVVMNADKVEHIKEAAAVMGQYCDIIGLRSFPSLKDRNLDYSEDILNKFIKYSGVPLISLESATLHPLQSFADMITIKENWNKSTKPKVVLTWAPHVKPLPQAVANSFSEWACQSDFDFVITHPKGYELDEKFTQNATINHDQDEAIANADFIYVKNWSSYHDYGKMIGENHSWMLTEDKLKLTNDAKVMHCLPVRRGVELGDDVIDGPSSIIMQQVNNRVYSAQTILKLILENNV